ncbi:MAG: transposase [Candidatus Competibacteraceae bacterium]|nr:transposase [Candidatus Competibacteraceae bacterium]
MIKRTPEVRDKLLHDFATGRQSAAEFCRSHGINEQTFSYWRKRQRHCLIR